MKNLETINRHNSDLTSIFTMGQNQMSDWTAQEFGMLHSRSVSVEAEDSSVDSMQTLDPWDWRNHGAATVVGKQGQCGSGWAFAAVSSIEAAKMIK